MTTARRGGWPGPRKIQVVVPFDPAQLARVEAYAERLGIKRAEAVRRATAVGMDRLEELEEEERARMADVTPDHRQDGA